MEPPIPRTTHGQRTTTASFAVRLGAVLAAVAVWLTLTTTPASASGPVITGFSPASGPVGTKVTITGSGFSPGLTVSFNSVPATNPKVNAAGTQIVVAVPPMATSGPIRVALATGAFTDSAEPFTVTFGASVSPRRLYVGQRLTIAGTAYPPFDDLTFSINGTTSLGGTATDSNGNFMAIRTIPDIPVGKIQKLEISCVSVACAQANLNFSLFTDWPQTRFDPPQTAFNAAEWLVDTSTVTTYHRQYDEGPPLSVTGMMVEKGGRLYYAGGTNNAGVVFSVKVGGLVGAWTASTGKPVTGLAVSGGVVYAVTWTTLYAFDANGVKNCGGGACNPLWTANLGSSAYPFPPVVWLNRVLVAEFGTGDLVAFDAAGVTNCSGSPKVCTSLWSDSYTFVFGPPAASSDGRIFLAVSQSGTDRVVTLDEFGGAVNKSAPLGGTQLFGPALSGTAVGGTVVVTRWDGGGSTGTLVALDAATLGGLGKWSSSGLGGADPPSTPAVSAKRAFVSNSAGRLLAFRLSGCRAATCDPLWTSNALGTGNSAPPIVSGGVVFHAANAIADSRGLAQIYAFDEAGQVSCSGSPKICKPVAIITRNVSMQPGSVGLPGGMLEAGGVLYGVGADGWTAFVQ